jgi:Ras-related protein Rab-20
MQRKKVHLKVVIIGAAAVGKTTFVHRYIEKQFQDSISTLGASFSLKQWGSYNIAIWDTAGEERFRGLSNFYCRNAGAAIVAFDLTDEDSFHALRAIFVPLLESALEDCIKVVIGTKSDLLSTHARAVSIEDGQNLATEINQRSPTKTPMYFETSSLTGANVEEVFETLFNLCVPAMKERLEQEVGGSAVNLKNESSSNQRKSSCVC